MQKGDISYDSVITASAGDKSAGPAASSLHFSNSSNPFFSPTSPTYVNSDALFYSSLFGNYSSSSTSDTDSFDGGEINLRLEEASSVENQQLYNRYTLCLTQLCDSIEEADALRRENESLRLSNADLSHRIALLFSRDRLLSEFNHLSVAPPSASLHHAAHVISNQRIAEHNRVERTQRRSTERITLPKSISVSTCDYLKMTQPGRSTTGSKSVSQSTAALQQQRVCRGGSKYENGEEMDAYDQGMSKTELCNKWQETGACPYGENCQFAHGIKELRPVMRHPRYKTEFCRAGDSCPYSHRCHFRHALTEQERNMALPPPPPR